MLAGQEDLLLLLRSLRSTLTSVRLFLEQERSLSLHIQRSHTKEQLHKLPWWELILTTIMIVVVTVIAGLVTICGYILKPLIILSSWLLDKRGGSKDR